MKSKLEVKEKVYQIISSELEIDISAITDELSVGSIQEWDSLSHIGLITAVEVGFDIKFEIDHVFELEEVDDFVEIIAEILQIS